MIEKVVKYKPCPRNRVSIKLSGGQFFTIPESEALSFTEGAVLGEADVERLRRIAQYLKGKDKAVSLISIRLRSKIEIEVALSKLGVEEGIIRGVSNELSKIGLIDDLKFAREYARTKMEARGCGPRRLDFGLKRLGVSASIRGKVLDEAFSHEKQESMARSLAEKKVARAKLDERTVRRVSDFLKRKGFDFDIVNRITFELLKRIDRQEGRDWD